MLYTTFSSSENHYFGKEFLDYTIFYSVRTFASNRQHYFSKYWGDQCMGRPPTSIFWGGTVPSAPLRLRPCSAAVTAHLVRRTELHIRAMVAMTPRLV